MSEKCFCHLSINEESYQVKDATARNSIETLNNTVNNLSDTVDNLSDINNKTLWSNRKVIMVGDSYADGYTPDGDVTSWHTILKNLLGISDANYKSVHTGGYGFGVSNSFTNLLTNLVNDSEVTDVIVAGGYNDLNATEEQITQGINNFKTTVNQKFPNAKIHIGFIGWSKTGSSITKLSNIFMYYKKACMNNLDIDFMEGVQYSLHNYFKYFSSDGIHPNEDGENSIGKAIAHYLLKGYVNIRESEKMYVNSSLGGIGGDSVIKTTLQDGKVNISYEVLSHFTFSSDKMPTLSGRSLIEIGTITNGLIVGTDSNNCTVSGIPCVVQCDDSKYYSLNISLTFKDGKIYVSSNLTNETNNNYGTKVLKAIQFTPFNATFDALNC